MSSPGLPGATHPLAYRRERRRQASYNSRAAPTHSYAAGCPGRGLGTCHPGRDMVHRPHHTPREPGPEPSARLASPAPAPPPACCAHPPEPPGRGRLPQPLSGILGRATTQQGWRQSPGVARSSLNQKPPQGPPEHSGVLAPDTGAPCPQLDSGHRSPPVLLLNSSLGAPPGRKHHGGECGRCREKQEPWWGLHQAASTPRQNPASWAPAAASWGLRQESWPPHGPSRILSCYTNRPEGPWMPPPSRRRAARSCKRDGGGEPCRSGGPLGWRHGAAGLGCRAATVAVAAGPHAWRTPPPVGLTPWA